MKATLTAVMLAVLVASAGEIRINSLDVEADRAVSVTGAQSNQLARAAAAAGYAYSPTNPPPAAGNVTSVNGQTGVVVITAEDLGAVSYDITVTTNGPSWFLTTEGLSWGDGEALAAGTYTTTIPQYLQTGVYRIEGGAVDQFWVTNTGGNVTIVFAPIGTENVLYPQYYTETAEGLPSATLEPLSGDNPQGTATLTFTEIVTVTTNFYATGADVAAAVAPKLDRTSGTATNFAVVGALTVNGEPIGQCPVWQSCGPMPAAGATQYPTLSQTAISFANTATSLWFVIQHPSPRSHTVLQLQAYATALAAQTNPVAVYVRTGGYAELASPAASPSTVICSPDVMDTHRATNIVYVAPSSPPTYGGAFIRLDFVRPNTLASGAVTVCPPFWRCATSNEIATKTFAR